MALKVGDKAPDFKLFDADRAERSLGEFLTRKTVLAFFPGAFTGVCTKEMCALRDSLTNFNTMNAQVVGVSVDGPFASKAFATANQLTFPLLCDFTRTVARQYAGVHDDFAGVKGYSASKRAVFVLDTNRTVRYAWISENPGVEPPYDEIAKALKSF
ncbi:MAG TPA: redoxin domain-containing protein [Bacteroidota bacterium]|nr:redoxin domain-containing protein [Bacteroidota bacterium]